MNRDHEDTVAAKGIGGALKRITKTVITSISVFALAAGICSGWSQAVPFEKPELPVSSENLQGRPIPTPSNFSEFLKNKATAIALGKARFWDMQHGSDGITVCSPSHFYGGGEFQDQKITDLDSNLKRLRLAEAEKHALVTFERPLTKERVRKDAGAFDHQQFFIPNGRHGDENNITHDGQGRAAEPIIEQAAPDCAGGAVRPNFLQ